MKLNATQNQIVDWIIALAAASSLLTDLTQSKDIRGTSIAGWIESQVTALSELQSHLKSGFNEKTREY